MGRKPFPQFNAFRSFINDEFTRRKNQYPTSLNSPFVRLVSCMKDPDHNPPLSFFTLGLHGFDNADIDIFSEAYTTQSDIVGYAYTDSGDKVLVHVDDLTRSDVNLSMVRGLDPQIQQQILQESSQIASDQSIHLALGAHPIPGITKVSVRRAGLGTPVIANVEYTCYNRNQLEFLRNHFMIVGAHVVLEWGNQFSDYQPTQILDYSDPDIIPNTIVPTIKQGRAYVFDNWVLPNQGNYDFIVGVVSNFKVNIQDARTGIFTCTTDIVSNGEQFRGVMNYSTYFDKTNPEQRIATTISDYFQIGHGFDTLIGQLSRDPKLVCQLNSKFSKATKITTDIKDVSTNPEDYKFVSWEFFVKYLIPQLCELIKLQTGSDTIKNLIDFWNDYEDVLPEDEHNWVGDNQFLKSTTPDVMIIVKNAFKNLVPEKFQGAGFFDGVPGADGTRGKLRQGIWLNVGMIRQSFLSTAKLEEGIKSILTQMSQATDDLWQLILFFDDEIGKFRVIDANYGDPRTSLDFYRFNQGGQGETLQIDFDSAFPPELITQMMLYGFLKSQTSVDRDALLKTLPSIGQPNTFIFSMNWTNLQDVVQAQMAPSDNVQSSLNEQLVDTEQSDATSKSRVISNAAAPATPNMSNTPVAKAGQALGETNAISDATKASANAQMVPVKRNSVTNTTKTDPSIPIKSLTNPNVNPTFSANAQRLLAQLQLEPNVGEVVVVETFRPQERQDILYAHGRTEPYKSLPVVTHTQHSYHTSGQAMDLQIFDKNGKEITYNFHSRLTTLAQQFQLDTIPFSNTFQDPGHVQAQGVRLGVDEIKGVTYITGKTGNIPDAPIDPNETGNATITAQETAKQEADLKAARDNITLRFGDNIWNMIELLPSNMTSKIVRDGYQNPSKPNSHVVAFPTKTSVTITTQGISGVSISDGFFVDKLPFVFERYGVFQTVEVIEDILPSGWKTKIRGIFKLLWLDGQGNTVPKATPTQ